MERWQEGAGIRALALDRLWVADLPCVRTWSGIACVSFVIDASYRYIVGWQVPKSLRASITLTALAQVCDVARVELARM